MVKGIILGSAATVLAGLLGAYLFIAFGFLPANADAPPPALEIWAARRALHASLAREAQRGTGPLAVNDENIIAGIKLYAANCAVCHGAADGAPSSIARGLYQRPPQLALRGVQDELEGEIHWKIKRGIRLTGMPAYGPSLNDNEIWKLTVFLKHMNALAPKAAAAWKNVPSAGGKSPSKPGSADVKDARKSEKPA